MSNRFYGDGETFIFKCKMIDENRDVENIEVNYSTLSNQKF